MSAEKVKEQVQFECEVKVGDRCQALWTNSGRYYQTEVEVVAVNSKSFGVKIATAIEGYPVGWRINIPNFANSDRWSWNNRLGQLACQEEKDKVFYSLCEDDILEVANALGVELTPDEMTRAKDGVADGVGEHWWDVTEDVIGDILRERRKSDVSSESDH